MIALLELGADGKGADIRGRRGARHDVVKHSTEQNNRERRRATSNRCFRRGELQRRVFSDKKGTNRTIFIPTRAELDDYFRALRKAKGYNGRTKRLTGYS